ncbi:protein FAM83D [Spea bombifrons]|uniref:protein FAM83D n=1 Tax=Spea bombifrons TaxID=233779 RepID=UPI00234A7EEF|nr:protein FAM83D [Spea bombifrons]
MANLSQCLEDAPLGCRLPAAPPDLYSEAQRLALEELVSGGPGALRGFLQKERVPGFLSEPEIGEIMSCVASLQCPEDEGSVSGTADCSSVTYFPELSDVEPPLLELGWPAFNTGSYRGATRVETHFQPSFGETIYSCKEAVRALIRAAREVIAVVMDSFTDNDLFRDMHEASRKRKVPVYILVDHMQLPHFLKMCQNLGVSLETEQLMRVRTLTGNNYYTRSGAKIVGKAREKFLLVDGLKVATGSYSFTWMDGKLNSSNLLVLSGQAVENFDLQFRILYAQSKPVNIKSLSIPRNRTVSQLLCNLPTHRKPTVSNLVQMELAKLSSTPKKMNIGATDALGKEVAAVDNLRAAEDDWMESCDIISGLKETENVATQTEPWEAIASVKGTDAATQTSVYRASAMTQTYMPARVASTQTVKFSREMTTQTTEPSVASQGQNVSHHSTATRLSTDSSTSSSSSSSVSSMSTGSNCSIRSSGTIVSNLNHTQYPLRDCFKKLTKDRQYHYSTIRSKLDHMVTILSRKNRFGSSYLGCEPTGYGFQRRDVMHSSLLNLRDGTRFAPNI